MSNVATVDAGDDGREVQPDEWTTRARSANNATVRPESNLPHFERGHSGSIPVLSERSVIGLRIQLIGAPTTNFAVEAR